MAAYQKETGDARSPADWMRIPFGVVGEGAPGKVNIGFDPVGAALRRAPVEAGAEGAVLCWLTGSRLLGYATEDSDVDVDIVVAPSLDDLKLGKRPVDRRGSFDLDLPGSTVRVEYVVRDALKQMRMMRTGDVRAMLVLEADGYWLGDVDAHVALDDLASRLRRSPSRLAALLGYTSNALEGWRREDSTPVGLRSLARACATGAIVARDFSREHRHVAYERLRAAAGVLRSGASSLGFVNTAARSADFVERVLADAEPCGGDVSDAELVAFMDRMLALGSGRERSAGDRRAEAAAKSLDWLAFNFPLIEEPEDECDRMSSNIHRYCEEGAAVIRDLMASNGR